MSTEKAWFEDEELWRIFGSCMFTEEQFQSAAQEIQQLILLIGEKPQSVLDLGCGPGRHSLALAELGVEVTGLDLSDQLLQQARDRSEARGLTIEWIKEDMRHFQRDRGFDLIVSMWTSFGYFDDPDDDLLVLQRCYENLQTGGRLVIDVTGKEYVLRHIQPVHLTEYDDGKLLIERPILSDNMTRYENEWLLIDGNRAYRTQWFQNLYSGPALMEMLYQTGFGCVELYGSLDQQPYDLDAERLVVVAEKP